MVQRKQSRGKADINRIKANRFINKSILYNNFTQADRCMVEFRCETDLHVTPDTIKCLRVSSCSSCAVVRRFAQEFIEQKHHRGLRGDVSRTPTHSRHHVSDVMESCSEV